LLFVLNFAAFSTLNRFRYFGAAYFRRGCGGLSGEKGQPNLVQRPGCD